MKNYKDIDFGLVGGSSTNSINFPENLNREDVKVIERDLVFDTPYGESPKFMIFTVGEKKVISCRMHGWRPGIKRGEASKQVFWVFAQVGVKKVIAEGGVGSINRLLKPRDLMVPDDYIDYSQRQDVGFDSPYLLIMRDPICPSLSKSLTENAKSIVKEDRDRYVYNRGVYVNTDGRHFESRAEVRMFQSWQGDIVGQSITPEVYLAREIGACYAGLYMIVNYAEGIIQDWEHEELKEIFFDESTVIGNILVDTIKETDLNHVACGCSELRKETLVKDYKEPIL